MAGCISIKMIFCLDILIIGYDMVHNIYITLIILRTRRDTKRFQKHNILLAKPVFVNEAPEAESSR